MSCLGVHYSLSADEVSKLKSFKEDSDRLEHLQCEIEEAYFSDHSDRMTESDKSWDAMHRTVSGGALTYDTGPYPLRLAVIGGEPIYAESDYIMSLKKPNEVRDVARALPLIKKEEFRKNYEAIDPKAYGFPKSNEDFEYTWEWFTGVVTFYQKAADEGRWVLFTADQ